MMVAKKETSRNIVIKYDYTTYNGSINQLVNEAKEIVSPNNNLINEVIGYVNKYRMEVGVSSINYDYNLNVAATIRALEMGWANKYDHTRHNGSTCFTVLSDMNIGFSWRKYCFWL